jgi:glyoxylase-like metal-dependent hydrolase (beta-lactamase superfamily II)
MKTLIPGVHRVPVGIVNTYLLETAEALVLIDTGFPNSAEPILRAIGQLGHPPEKLGHIVLTHAHPDHVGSVAALVRATGAQTWMHHVDAPLVERAEFRPVHPSPGLLPKLLLALMQRLPRAMEPATIDHRIDDGAVLPFGLRAIHAPGHCAGQVALLWPEHRLLFAADACMNLLRLRPPLVNEDAALGLRSLQRLAALNFDIACFGHGGPILQAADARFRTAFGTPSG